jgi:PKD repeat protein
MPRRNAPAHDAGPGARRVRRFGALFACTFAVLCVPAQSAWAVTVSGGSVSAVEGVPFTGTVAAFTDLAAVGCQATASYTATVVWADSTSSPGAVGAPTQNGLNCTYPVSAGPHTFAEEGTQAFHVTVSGILGTGTADGTATIADAPLAAAPVGLGGPEATTLSATLATFVDADPAGVPGDYAASVAWGDGTSGAGTITIESGGRFGVFASHPYAQPGSYTATVTVTDAGGSLATTHVPVTIADSPLTSAGTQVAATEGQALSATMATFSDPDTSRAPGYYSASVAWGDGTASTPTLAAKGGGGFAVDASHTYADAGSYTATIIVIDPSGQHATTTTSVTVADAALSSTGAQLAATEGTALNATLARFHDADAGRAASHYSASVSFGDGTPPGSGSVAGDGSGGFTVSAGHTYANAGSYAATVTIADPGGQQTAAATSVSVADAALSSTAVHLTTTEGAPLSAPVAHFHDADPGRPPSHYAATVSWGDGSAATSGAIAGDGSGGFVVSGDHTFLAPGGYTATVTIADPDGRQTTAPSTISVDDAVITAHGTELSGLAGAPIAGPVATFTDGDPNATPANYTATVSWGDGATTTDPSITADPAGGFAVSASHAYAQAGTFSTAITVRDNGGSTGSTAGTVTVAAPAPPPATPDTTPAPTPPAPAGKAPPPPPPPLVSVSAPRLGSVADTLSLRLTCPASAPRCRGVSRVITVPTRTHRSPLRGGTSLGSTLFVLGSGETRTVSITVAKKLRTALRQSRSARLAGVAIAFGASGHNQAATGPSAVLSTTGLR